MSPKSRQQQEDRQTEAQGHCFSMNDRKKRTAQFNREKVVLGMSEIKKERERERERNRATGEAGGATNY